MADDWKEERVSELGRRRLRALPADCYLFEESWGTDRILRHGLSEILINQRIIMADLTKLQASVASLTTSVDALLADTTSQPAVDAIQASVDALNTAVTAVLPPPAPAA